MDVPVPLILVIAAIFVPTLCAILLELAAKRLYALGLVGLAGIGVLPLTLRTNAVAASVAYALVSSATTVALCSRSSRPRLGALTAALAVSLTIVTAALAWVSTLAP